MALTLQLRMSGILFDPDSPAFVPRSRAPPPPRPPPTHIHWRTVPGAMKTSRSIAVPASLAAQMGIRSLVDDDSHAYHVHTRRADVVLYRREPLGDASGPFPRVVSMQLGIAYDADPRTPPHWVHVPGAHMVGKQLFVPLEEAEMLALESVVHVLDTSGQRFIMLGMEVKAGGAEPFMVLKRLPKKAREIRAPGAAPQKVRPVGPCAYCGLVNILTKDHVWPKSRGMDSLVSNLAMVCKSCNERKGDVHLGRWVHDQLRIGAPDAATIYENVTAMLRTADLASFILKEFHTSGVHDAFADHMRRK